MLFHDTIMCNTPLLQNRMHVSEGVCRLNEEMIVHTFENCLVVIAFVI